MTLIRACGKPTGAASGTCTLWPQGFKCYCRVSGGREGEPVGAVTGNPCDGGARRETSLAQANFTQEYQGRWGCGEQRTVSSLPKCRRENPSYHLIHRESEMNNRPPVEE